MFVNYKFSKKFIAPQDLAKNWAAADRLNADWCNLAGTGTTDSTGGVLQTTRSLQEIVQAREIFQKSHHIEISIGCGTTAELAREGLRAASGLTGVVFQQNVVLNKNMPPLVSNAEPLRKLVALALKKDQDLELPEGLFNSIQTARGNLQDFENLKKLSGEIRAYLAPLNKGSTVPLVAQQQRGVGATRIKTKLLPGAQNDCGPTGILRTSGKIRVRDPKTGHVITRSGRRGLIMAPDGTPTSPLRPNG